MGLSKSQIKKAITLGEEFHTKFMQMAERKGSTEAITRVMDTLMSKYWSLYEEIGNFDIYVDKTKVVTWEGMTREQMRNQLSIAFLKTSK
jgi:hypothetical protein